MSDRTPFYQLAQYNVVDLSYHIDSPELAGFHALLDPIHHAGDIAPGFVWRFKGATGDYALDVRPSDGNTAVLIAMTVWESPEALDAFMRGPHFEAFIRRREWFKRGSGENVCWWVEEGHRPTVKEGENALAFLRLYGPTMWAFTLRRPFPPPSFGDVQ